MKRLTIAYGDAELFDGEVEEFTWQESATAVVVSGKVKRKTAPASTGLLDMLTSASRQRTDAKKAALTAEPTKESDD